ncbi:hypothetical protein, partial [Schaalia odontolytica]|uniref:hypothetical protein n=1 Tax=Schaalia odontolytica TaxID=1660 RepID=UPI002109E68D
MRKVVFNLTPHQIPQLERVLEHVFVDPQLVLNLLDLVRDLSHLIVDLNAGLSGKANEFGIVQDLGEFGGAH